jgi:uncharacterized membrane protein YdbT with pleckstrin-like domain
MSYLQESLAPGEVIIARFHLHWTAKGRLFGWIFLLIAGAVLAIATGQLPSPVAAWSGLALALIALLGAFVAWLRLRAFEFGVTNRRVIYKRGIVGRDTEEVRLSAIETVDLHQSTWGRMLGFGDVRVTGRGESTLLLTRVADPVAVKRAIETAYAAVVEHNPAGQTT